MEAETEAEERKRKREASIFVITQNGFLSIVYFIMNLRGGNGVESEGLRREEREFHTSLSV